MLLPTLTWLSEAFLLGGHSRSAFHAAEEGLEVSRSTEAHYFRAELLRLRGEAAATLRGSPSACADGVSESAFREAIAVSRAQGARFFELRAALSLCRFLVATGRHGDARSALDAACAEWDPDLTFTDLADARALVARL
jgi:hypothetical protein